MRRSDSNRQPRDDELRQSACLLSPVGGSRHGSYRAIELLDSVSPYCSARLDVSVEFHYGHFAKMKPPGQVIISFLGAFVITTVINVVLWQFVAANLYDCGDDAIPGYLEPGHWVHSVNGRSVTTVSHIVHNRDMSEPDTIKEGWTAVAYSSSGLYSLPRRWS